MVTPTSAGPAAASSAPIVTSTACPGTQSASVAACPDRATTACPGDATKKRKRQVLAHVRSGVLAVLRRDGNASTQTLQDIDADYSDKMKESVLRAITNICTPHAGTCDEELRDHVLKHIFTYTSDGGSAVLKCGKLLQTAMPNMRLILRDPAHAMRIATGQLANGFSEFWSDIFDNKHALVPDIQNSDAWQTKLMLAQKHILQTRGHQGGGLTTALKHLSFAKQRFDSASGPARKYCCLLSAIALLLIAVASDNRLNTATRQRAQTALGNMTPQHITIAGLFADYSAEALRFIRSFDTSDHDIARTNREKQQFRKRMRILFVDGHVLAEPPPGAPGVPGATCTYIAISQAMECGKLYYNNRCLHLWPPSARAEAERALATMRDLVNAALDRVDAEFPPGSLLIDFAAFDLKIWDNGFRFQDQRKHNEAELVLSLQRRRARHLAKSHPFIESTEVDEAATAVEAAAKMLRRSDPRAVAREDVDNQAMWDRVLSEQFPEFSVSPALSRLIEWYLSIADGSCDVERNLGRLTATLASHKGPLDPNGDHVSALLEIDLDGPKVESALAMSVQSSIDTPRPNDSPQAPLPPAVDIALQCNSPSYFFKMSGFMRRCAELWVDQHGRRFCVYHTKRVREKGPKPLGTDVAVARGQKRALDLLVDRADRGQARVAQDQTTVLGVSRTKLLARANGTNIRADALKRFRNLTAKKLKPNARLMRDGLMQPLYTPFQHCAWAFFFKTQGCTERSLPSLAPPSCA